MRRLVLDFACALFLHRLDVREDFTDSVRCECGIRHYSRARLVAWGRS